jgi:hypothetical protein
MDQTNLRYDHLIKNHLEHLKRRYQALLVDAATLPQFWFLTTTFLPVEAKRDDHIPIPPHRCFDFFERFYVRLLSRLMNNFQRKSQRPLQPLTYLYIDYPFTKREKTHARAIFFLSVLLAVLALLVRYAHVAIPIVSHYTFETPLLDSYCC